MHPIRNTIGLPMIQVVYIRDDIVAIFWFIIVWKEELRQFKPLWMLLQDHF